ncbi:MAG TPA: antibiotic biosynthesis monooxygenase [Candidatus Saccharimonadia bacterium]|nr:antibiotic biosynthesis monooxygenase [Candidatus Saccharimonadia bacterium]
MSQQKMEPGTIVFIWTVRPGKEEQFEQYMHEIHKVARTFPGHMGVTTLKSQAQKGNFQTILRFDTTEHLEDWLNSPIRKKLAKRIEKVAHVDAAPKTTGLETWFEIPGQTIPPPRWKMVLTTFVAIYPLSLLYGYLIAPNITALPTPIRALFLPVFAPVILTYLFMPFLTQKVLKSWLYKTT